MKAHHAAIVAALILVAVAAGFYMGSAAAAPHELHCGSGITFIVEPDGDGGTYLRCGSVIEPGS